MISPPSAYVARFVRFGLTGAASTAVHVIVALVAMRLFGAGPVVGNAVAYSVATSFSYLLNTCWSFSANLTKKTLARFLVVSAFGGTLTIILAAVVNMLGGGDILGILVIVVLVPPSSFIMHSLWTYRS